MALAVGVSRISLFKASTLDFNGSNRVSSGCSLAPPADAIRLVVLKSAAPRKHIVCSAVQESSTPTVSAETKEAKPEAETKEAKPEAETKEAKAEAETREAKPEAETKEAKAEAETKEAKPEAETKEAKPEAKAAPAKPKPAAKAPAKALPQMMEEDIIPALRSILEAQEDITDLELFFKDNTLEGSFLQKDKPYTFWAFFPDGVLTGPKGFSLSSYGSEVSTVEPFLVDEKKITANLVVFWVEKRLAAQGIIPVWKE